MRFTKIKDKINSIKISMIPYSRQNINKEDIDSVVSHEI